MSNSRVFGPVPSRRLGRSLGINNIPPKICTYSCVYCQIGRSLKMQGYRQAFYDPKDLSRAVEEKIFNLKEHNNGVIDYITIVPDGEPTLDINLGELISLLKPLGLKIAVITNSTLLHDPLVRQDLSHADWVSVKVDAYDEDIWTKIDRPLRKIRLDKILNGINTFSEEFNQILVSETMLVKDLNDSSENIKKIADFLLEIDPSIAYISIPTRPPAEKWVKPPDENTLNRAFQIFQESGVQVEYLIGYEGNEFASTGNIEEDLLSITSVHPMREDAVEEYLIKASGDYSTVERLIEEGKLVVTEYQHARFYLRKFKSIE